MLNDFSPPPRPEQGTDTPNKPVDSTPPNTGNPYGTPQPSQPLEPLTTPEDKLTMPPAKPPKAKWSKKKKAVIFGLPVLLLAGFGAWWLFMRSEPEVNNTPVTNTAPQEEAKDDGLVPSPLSGLDVPEADAARPVTAIMIENSGEARPQSGLYDAEVVFEAIAEGGITRFVALFQANKPNYIGPVRSARPYYVEWAAAFNAGYVHAGGSPAGIRRIGDLGLKSISPYTYGSRTSDRAAPHNLYTGFNNLDKATSGQKSTFKPWQRKDDMPQKPLAKTIDITISSSFYNVRYTYDQATNSYQRSMGGSAHNDEKSRKRIAPKTVLIMAMNRTQSGIYSVYSTVGEGKFKAYQDGVVSEGTWRRTGYKDNYTFKDKYGQEFNFNKGQVWVSVVGSISDAKHKP